MAILGKYTTDPALRGKDPWQYVPDWPETRWMGDFPPEGETGGILHGEEALKVGEIPEWILREAYDQEAADARYQALVTERKRLEKERQEFPAKFFLKEDELEKYVEDHAKSGVSTIDPILEMRAESFDRKMAEYEKEIRPKTGLEAAKEFFVVKVFGGVDPTKITEEELEKKVMKAGEEAVTSTKGRLAKAAGYKTYKDMPERMQLSSFEFLENLRRKTEKEIRDRHTARIKSVWDKMQDYMDAKDEENATDELSFVQKEMVKLGTAKERERYKEELVRGRPPKEPDKAVSKILKIGDSIISKGLGMDVSLMEKWDRNQQRDFFEKRTMLMRLIQMKPELLTEIGIRQAANFVGLVSKLAQNPATGEIIGWDPKSKKWKPLG